MTAAVPDPRFRAQLAEDEIDPTCTRRVSPAADDEDIYECGRPATVEAFTTSGQWEPHCVTHVQGWPVDRVRDLYPIGTYAAICVTDGVSKAWPVVERVVGGWQSGEHHYPDAAVSSVRVLPLAAEVEARVQAAAKDAVERAAQAVEALRPHIPPSTDPNRRTSVIVRSTLNRAARAVRAALAPVPDDADGGERR